LGAFPLSLWFTDGVFCDPQLGCDNHFRTFDISGGDSTQLSEEVRLQSNYSGPFNFDVGAIYVDYKLEPSTYFVYSNTLTAAAIAAGLCPAFVDYTNPAGRSFNGCNYYLNRSNYELESWAVDGEFYYQPTEDLRFTIGARYTDDTKDVAAFSPILFANVGSQPVTNQHAEFQEWTGRAGFDWHLHPSFTDSTLLYAFYSRGYKGGGFNPPSSVGIAGITATFAPEFVDAFEVGLKNELFDRHMIFNLTGFYYDYQGYQISKIVNRSSVNENIDAVVRGVEMETVFQPFEGWRFNATAGWLDTEIQGGSSIDTFDRTQGDSTLTLIHDPFTAQNCVIPTATFTAGLMGILNAAPAALGYACATGSGLNPLGLDAISGAGHPVDLTGNELPNSPHWTASVGGQYQWALGGGWEATARADYYYQGESYARIYNSAADQIDSRTNLNLMFRIENPSDGLTFEVFGQNVTDETSITGVYLTDDSSGLFRNVFLTEPRTIGMRLMKQW
jgi:outer membrane receptor protein involved in Fe transport